MKKPMILTFAAAALAGILTAGCATSVPVTLMRPAELDLRGAKTITVLPFRISTDKAQSSMPMGTNITIVFGSRQSTDDVNEIEIADYLTTQLEQRLSGSQYIDLVNARVVETALNSGREPPVDVYLTGKIARLDSVVIRKSDTETVDGKTVTIEYYKRHVSLTVNYEIVDAKTNKVIASKSAELSADSSETKDIYAVAKTFSLIKPELDNLTSKIMKELQPYEVTVYLTLMKDELKDPDMKEAEKMAQQGYLAQARETYLRLYETRGNYAAGYNAAMLIQAEGDLEGARELLLELKAKSPAKETLDALRNVDYEIRQSQKLHEQTGM